MHVSARCSLLWIVLVRDSVGSSAVARGIYDLVSNRLREALEIV